MTVFKTPKEWARAFLLVSGTLILAGLYFIPVVIGLKTETELFNYLMDCRNKYEIVYTMLVTFYLREKVQDYLASKNEPSK